MSKIVKIKKSGRDSLYASFLMMTLIPLFVFGMIVTSFISGVMNSSIKKQTMDELNNIASLVIESYDVTYPGNFNLLVDGNDQVLYKGETPIMKSTRVMDAVKETSDVDVSIYFANICMMTTITDEDGKRFVGHASADKIIDDVLINGEEKLYDNVEIAGVPYFAYYKPIYAIDKTTRLGMIGVAKPMDWLQATVNSAIVKNFLIMIVFMLITAFIIVRYTSSIMDCIRKILDFLAEIAGNNLSAKLDDTVQGRSDELGEIGQASIKLQLSLRKLIERDALTGLYNRRAAEKRLDTLESDGIKASISIGDIDHFKRFNDSFGHECGDVVLKEVAAALNEGMRGKGFVARWGGEEFLLVFENIEELAAGLFLNDILQSVRDRQVVYNDQVHAVTMTFGVTGRAEGEKVSDQIRRADDMLYEGKQGGRNRVIVGSAGVEAIKEEAEAKANEKEEIKAEAEVIENEETKAEAEVNEKEDIKAESDIDEEISEDADSFNE